jgi:hypothetical protein
MTALAQNLGLGCGVDFVGTVPNEDVPTAIPVAEVIIALRHARGHRSLCYETPTAALPIVASADVPRGASSDKRLMFPDGNADAVRLS